MPSLKTIKRRISSVDSTQQIVNAMDMVSASKLQKTKGQLESARIMFDEMNRIINGVRRSIKAAGNRFITGGGPKIAIYVVITGDRGLCGGYNQNISNAALAFMEEREADGLPEGQIVTVGQQGYDFFLSRGKEVMQSFTDISENAFYEDAAKIGELVVSLYVSGEAGEAYVAYTFFESALSHVPRVERLLPIGADEKSKLWYETVMYEPNADAFAEAAVPFYIDSYIYAAMVEAAACEHMARMTSMHSASDNAREILEDLTSAYNSKRQGIVTQEISEIAGGAKALRKNRS